MRVYSHHKIAKTQARITFCAYFQIEKIRESVVTLTEDESLPTVRNKSLHWHKRRASWHCEQLRL